MKLTIKNYEKIKGIYPALHIEDVHETPDEYGFYCQRRGGSTSYQIRLNRVGRIDHEGDWVYHFQDGKHKTQYVTAGYFQNMANAVDTIISEFDSQHLL